MIKTLLDQLLALIGAACSVLTILGRLSSTWPEWLVPLAIKLRAFMHGLIEPPFKLLGIPLDREIAGLLSFNLFLLSMAIGPFILSKIAGTDRFEGTVVPERIFGIHVDDAFDSVPVLIMYPLFVVFFGPPVIMMFVAFLGPSDYSTTRSVIASYWWGSLAFQLMWCSGVLAALWLGGTAFRRRIMYVLAMLWLIAAGWLLSPR